MSEDRASARNSKSENAARKQTGKKRPKKITETYLHNAGLYYLERFASSSGNFREVMLRKVKRSCMFHTDQDHEKCAAMVDTLVEKFISSGLLDDTIYTRGKVSSLRRRGKSARSIQTYLRAKGLPPALIKQELDRYNEEHHTTDKDAEYQAALTFARKKRIGPFRGDKDEDIQKELGRLARAGFSYDTSRSVLNYKSEEDPMIQSA